MTDPRIDPERLAKGRAVFTEVYGSDALLPPEGMMMPADMMITQAFAEVWSREALSIPIRRLLVIGVLAATGEAGALQIQFQRALSAGELTEEQLDEAVLQLAHYLGWPKLGMLTGAAMAAVKAYRTETTEQEEA